MLRTTNINLISLSILARCYPLISFEETDEVLRILEAEFGCHLCNAFFRMQQLFLCHIEHLQLDVFLCRFACLFLYQIAEIIGRKAHFIGEILYGRHSVFQCDVRIKIFVNQLLETPQHIQIHVLSGNELALIKPHTIIQQQFDVGTYKTFGMSVDGVLQFRPNNGQTVVYDHTFVRREMKGLVRLVREKVYRLIFCPSDVPRMKSGWNNSPTDLGSMPPIRVYPTVCPGAKLTTVLSSKS